MFTEKPDKITAAKYLKTGGYYWNSGMFMFSIKTMLSEMKTHAPDIYRFFNSPFKNISNSFGALPSISIDYAVMEKSRRAAVLPVELLWSDLGSWDQLAEAMESDSCGNVFIGDVLNINSRGVLVYGGKRLVSAVGVKDIILVDTEDAILLVKKGQAQQVKEVVEKLKERNRKEVEEHLTVYRPWGSYIVLEEGPRYKIKRIVLKPGHKLTSQLHYHRSEHWVVLKGAARVIIGGRSAIIHENESTYVPKSTAHRLENPGKVPLEMIEVENGEYVGEDDIIRFNSSKRSHK